jgi:phosphonopyruvate decarboxylase
MNTREEAINLLLDKIGNNIIIGATGKISRELFELRVKRGEDSDDFYMMGSMGHALAIGLGLAINTKKKVYVLNGDAGCLMKLGTLATHAKILPNNLVHIVLDNGCHDSTGGQRTAFRSIAKCLPNVRIIRVKKGARSNLGRPDISPRKIANNFHRKVFS